MTMTKNKNKQRIQTNKQYKQYRPPIDVVIVGPDVVLRVSSAEVGVLLQINNKSNKSTTLN